MRSSEVSSERKARSERGRSPSRIRFLPLRETQASRHSSFPAKSSQPKSNFNCQLPLLVGQEFATHDNFDAIAFGIFFLFNIN